MLQIYVDKILMFFYIVNHIIFFVFVYEGPWHTDLPSEKIAMLQMYVVKILMFFNHLCHMNIHGAFT